MGKEAPGRHGAGQASGKGGSDLPRRALVLVLVVAAICLAIYLLDTHLATPPAATVAATQAVAEG